MNIKSTAIFDFLLKKLSSLLRNLTYLSLLNSFWSLSRFSVSLKSLDNYRWFVYKSLLSRFSVLISYNMCSSNHFPISSRFPCFSRSRFLRVQVFQGRGFSRSGFFRVQVFRVRVQVIEVAHFNENLMSIENSYKADIRYYQINSYQTVQSVMLLDNSY